MSELTAECRGCEMKLKGEPYYRGKDARHPETGEICKKNYYGGFVCSDICDYNSSKELEQSIPGAGRFVSLSSLAYKHYHNNWKD